MEYFAFAEQLHETKFTADLIATPAYAQNVLDVQGKA